MLRHFAPGLIVDRVRISLNLVGIVIRIEGSLYYFEVLRKLQGDFVRAGIQAASSPVANAQKDSKDGLDAMPDDLHLARIYRKFNVHISRPQAVAILAVVAAGKGAARPRFVPAHDRQRRILIGFV